MVVGNSTIDVLISPTMANTNYKPVATLNGTTISVLGTVRIIGVAPKTTSVVTVSLQNTGLVTLNASTASVQVLAFS